MRLALLLVGILSACSGDEREPATTGNPAYDYCLRLGYTVDYVADGCTFPDGSSCAAFQFYDGACGQSFSYCEQHGGTLSTRTETVDASIFVYAECTTSSGATCHEVDYAETHKCK